MTLLQLSNYKRPKTTIRLHQTLTHALDGSAYIRWKTCYFTWLIKMLPTTLVTSAGTYKLMEPNCESTVFFKIAQGGGDPGIF